MSCLKRNSTTTWPTLSQLATSFDDNRLQSHYVCVMMPQKGVWSSWGSVENVELWDCLSIFHTKSDTILVELFGAKTSLIVVYGLYHWFTFRCSTMLVMKTILSCPDNCCNKQEYHIFFIFHQPTIMNHNRPQPLWEDCVSKDAPNLQKCVLVFSVQNASKT